MGATFDTSGGPKGAKRPLERPLDGRVSRHSHSDSGQYTGSQTCRAMGAMDCSEIPRSLQYLNRSQCTSGFVPLLELQPAQHNAMFAEFTSSASLTMCSTKPMPSVNSEAPRTPDR